MAPRRPASIPSEKKKPPPSTPKKKPAKQINVWTTNEFPDFGTGYPLDITHDTALSQKDIKRAFYVLHDAMEYSKKHNLTNAGFYKEILRRTDDLSEQITTKYGGSTKFGHLLRAWTKRLKKWKATSGTGKPYEYKNSQGDLTEIGPNEKKYPDFTKFQNRVYNKLNRVYQRQQRGPKKWKKSRDELGIIAEPTDEFESENDSYRPDTDESEDSNQQDDSDDDERSVTVRDFIDDEATEDNTHNLDSIKDDDNDEEGDEDDSDHDSRQYTPTKKRLRDDRKPRSVSPRQKKKRFALQDESPDDDSCSSGQSQISMTAGEHGALSTIFRREGRKSFPPLARVTIDSEHYGFVKHKDKKYPLFKNKYYKTDNNELWEIRKAKANSVFAFRVATHNVADIMEDMMKEEITKSSAQRPATAPETASPMPAATSPTRSRRRPNYTPAATAEQIDDWLREYGGPTNLPTEAPQELILPGAESVFCEDGLTFVWNNRFFVITELYKYYIAKCQEIRNPSRQNLVNFFQTSRLPNFRLPFQVGNFLSHGDALVLLDGTRVKTDGTSIFMPGTGDQYLLRNVRYPRVLSATNTNGDEAPLSLPDYPQPAVSPQLPHPSDTSDYDADRQNRGRPGQKMPPSDYDSPQRMSLKRGLRNTD